MGIAMSKWKRVGDEPSDSMWKLPEFMVTLFKVFPHTVPISDANMNKDGKRNTTEILYWATEQFGPRMIALDRLEENPHTECRWAFLGHIAMFKDANDAFAFKVRWG